MKALSRTLAALIMPVLLSGCATYDMMKPPPAEARPISIVYTKDGPSGWTDLPIGTYRVPDTTVIISGHQQGGGIGMLFGVAGVLVQDAVNSGIGKGKVGNVQDALHIDLAPQADTITKDLLASGRYAQTFAPANDPGGPTLEVAPFTVLTFANATDVRPYVILKATLRPSAAGAGVWTTRYIASAGPPVALTGDNSLTADDGKLLKSTLALELDRAVKAMLDDVARHAARNEADSVYVESALPYVKFRMGLVGARLSDDGPGLVYVPKVADANVFAGVHVLDKATTTYHPATAADAPKMLDDGN